MAKTTLNVKADVKVKRRAQKVAQDLGMPLSVVINAYLRQFIRTKEVHFFAGKTLNPKVKKQLERLHKEAVEGKNLSPVFHSAEKMDVYLNSLQE